MKIRVAEEDVEKERGAVLEEWRERRNAAGRMQEAYWQLLMKGSKASCSGQLQMSTLPHSVTVQAIRVFNSCLLLPRRQSNQFTSR